MSDQNTLFDKAESFQSFLVSFATGGGGEASEYKALRQELLTEPLIADKLPHFVQTCRDLDQYWQFIKHKFGSYQERREYLWSEFALVLQFLEEQMQHPIYDQTAGILQKLNAEAV